MTHKTQNPALRSILLILEAIQKSDLALKPILVLQPQLPQRMGRERLASLAVGHSVPVHLLRKGATPGNSRKPANRPLKLHKPKGGH